MRSAVVLVLFVFLIAPGICTQEITKDLTTDPLQARFVYDDLNRFIEVHKELIAGSDTVSILQTGYLDKGTPGLNAFIEKYDLTAERLVTSIRKYPADYDALAEVAAALPAQVDSARVAFVKLKQLIPDAVYPPTYFLVGASRGIGSGSVEGQLITVEKSASDIKKRRSKVTLICHELVHFQQVTAVGYENYVKLFGPEKSLLGLTIREGTAEFFANLVTGKMTQQKAAQYTRDNEADLWAEFRKEMDGSETGDWMWRKPSNEDQPPHVAYVLGAFIVDAYYQRSDDKGKAAKEILSVTDYEDFLEKSGYPDRWK